MVNFVETKKARHPPGFLEELDVLFVSYGVRISPDALL